MRYDYQFETDWLIEHELSEVWRLILASEQWPEWWPYVLKVDEELPGNESGIGNIRYYEFSCPFRYRLRFRLQLTDRIEHRLLHGVVSGDLSGEGSWHFENLEGRTRVRCIWNVNPKRQWMRRLSGLLRPVFKYNHRAVMRAGYTSLVERLQS